MEEVKVKNKKPILVKIADQLLKDQQELDAMAVQFSLGKAEAKEKFEVAKKQMKKSVKEFSEVLSAKLKQNKEWTGTFNNKLSELEKRLVKSKVDAKLMFEDQKKSIVEGIDELISEVKKNPDALKLADYFMAASEKLTLKLALIEKKLGAEKIELTNEFKEEMNHARTKINSVIEKLKQKKVDVDFKLENFNAEIKAAYSHLKSAMKAL